MRKSGTLPVSLTNFSPSQASDLIVHTLPEEKRAPKPAWDKLLFGHHCSDHMIKVRWTKADGWDTPTIVPVHNFSMHPYSKVFHYAQEVRLPIIDTEINTSTIINLPTFLAFRRHESLQRTGQKDSSLPTRHEHETNAAISCPTLPAGIVP